MATGCMIPLTRNVQNGQLYRDRKPISSCQRKGKRDTGSDCQQVERASFWSDGGALELDSGGGCAPLRLYKKAGNCAHGNWEVYGMQIIFKLFPVTFFKTIPPIMAVSNCSLLTVCHSGPCLWRKSAAPRRGQRQWMAGAFFISKRLPNCPQSGPAAFHHSNPTSSPSLENHQTLTFPPIWWARNCSEGFSLHLQSLCSNRSGTWGKLTSFHGLRFHFKS